MAVNRLMGFSRAPSNMNRGFGIAVSVCEEERRAHRRYAIATELNYRIVRQQRVLEEGSGQTVDISTSGISFGCARVLPIGSKIEISITWPPGSGGLRSLELAAQGRIVRVDRNITAISFKRSGFRGTGSS